MSDIVIAGALRTAIGKFGGALAKTPAPELGATVIAALLARYKVRPEQISEVILGKVLTAGSGQNPARQSMITAGRPADIPGIASNKVGGGGLAGCRTGGRRACAGVLPMRGLGPTTTQRAPGGLTRPSPAPSAPAM